MRGAGASLAISARVHRLFVLAVLATTACGGDETCELDPRPYRTTLRCPDELRAQAARPGDSSLPGALSAKAVLDLADGDAIYFQDTATYPLHRLFAVAQLGWPPGMPFTDQYYSPGRRFVLGAVTYYEEPDAYVYELAPYDTASAEQIARAFGRIKGATFFGDRLRFHPTSDEQEARVRALGGIPIVTTDELWAGITYQPLNLGETYARVRVIRAAELATTYVSPRELVVLDRVPNDLTVVAGVVTEELQTPLSHVNVLSQQRGTPNMGLRGAHDRFAGLDGRWVRLAVGAFAWEVAEVTADQAEAWWQAHRPPPVEIPAPDDSVTTVLDIDDVGLADIPRVGGKAAHYGFLRDLSGGAEPVRIHDALVVPVAFYRQFLVQHGFDARITAMLADPAFRADGDARRRMLDALRADMMAAPVDPAAVAAVEAAITRDFPGQRMRFRSSTNAEDLAHHTGAGLYTSASGAVGDPERPVARALATVWASVWNVRAFEERAYAGIDHTRVAMAVLLTPAFDDEAANGVAITANLYDPSRNGEDGFFVNGQLGEASVVLPDPGVTAEALTYFHFHLGRPATYWTRSNLLPPGTTVLTRGELFELGRALEAIRYGFDSVYDPPEGWGRMPVDVEWKLVEQGGIRAIWIKQARPYPGRGVSP